MQKRENPAPEGNGKPGGNKNVATHRAYHSRGDFATDSATIHQALGLLIEPGQVVELRLLNTSKGTVSGYFNDMGVLAKAAVIWSGKAPGVYIALNPVKPELLARAYNRVEFYAKHTTSDAEITARRWFPIDFDAKRPAGISATDTEHKAALQRARDCREFLRTLNWPEGIYADSGNGAHLLYQIELPNDDQSRTLLVRCMKALAAQFDDEAVNVDQSVHNAARIWKLYGTVVCKGDPLPDRPHRLARILEAPDTLDVVPSEMLQALAATLPEKPARPARPVNGADRNRSGAIAYVKAAFDNEINRVLQATDGNRNNALNAASFALGQIVASGVLEHGTVESALLDAAKRIGLDQREAERTIWSGIESGMKEPREIPEPRARHSGGKSDEEPPPDRDEPPPEAYESDPDLKGGGSKKEHKGEEDERKPTRKSQATELIELAGDIDLFHDTDDTAYGVISFNGHTETWPLRCREFKTFLARRFWKAKNKVPGSQALHDALNVIEGKACFDSPVNRVYLRVAEHDGRIYLDLCDSKWRVVEIDACGWRVVNNQKLPIRFVRRAGMLPLPEPTRGKISDLWPFLNISIEDARLLVAAWLVAALRPCGPYPVLIVMGEQGTAKSSFCRLLRSLIDPSVANLRTMPRDERDLAIWARNGHVIGLDNLSGMPVWLSDALCRIATGGGFSTRALYTDTDEVLIQVQRPLVLNGIDDVATRQDLINRAIILDLEPIAEDKRRSEKAISADFEEAKAGILGALLTAVSQAIREWPNVDMPGLPRMADFAEWAVAAETALGGNPGQFLEAYKENQSNAIEAGLAGSPVAAALEAMGKVRNWQPYTITPSDLLKELPRHYGDGKTDLPRSWPRSAMALRSQLKRLGPALRSKGINVTHGRDSDKRFYKIDWMKDKVSQPSQSSQTQQECGVSVTPRDDLKSQGVTRKPSNNAGCDERDTCDGFSHTQSNEHRQQGDDGYFDSLMAHEAGQAAADDREVL